MEHHNGYEDAQSDEYTYEHVRELRENLSVFITDRMRLANEASFLAWTGQFLRCSEAGHNIYYGIRSNELGHMCGERF